MRLKSSTLKSGACAAFFLRPLSMIVVGYYWALLLFGHVAEDLLIEQ
jgi:hypothetical protein